MTARRVEFQGWPCQIVRASYGATERIALLLYDLNDGSPVAVATVHVPDLPLAADEVVIKDYSENEGMLNTLVSAGIVARPSAWCRAATSRCTSAGACSETEGGRP
ncbi:MAG TPA: hypothetical protein PKD53_23500 [Chloroflexaceae bacterium]|nr:hypothetical protein [Chloroflexaceae bacterium]